jgi:hypothetical protein
MARGQTTAITLSARAEAWNQPDWQQLWLSIWNHQRRWRSLALVPAGAGASSETLLQIASSLAHTGSLHLRAPVHVANATRVGLSELEPFSAELAKYMRETELMVLALSSLAENVTTLSLAKSADCALLCVVLGQMSNTEAKKTVAQIGAARFIGSAVFRVPSPTTEAQAVPSPVLSRRSP